MDAGQQKCVKCTDMRVRCDFLDTTVPPTSSLTTATRPRRAPSPKLLLADSPKEPSKKCSRTNFDAKKGEAPSMPVGAGPSCPRRRKSFQFYKCFGNIPDCLIPELPTKVTIADPSVTSTSLAAPPMQASVSGSSIDSLGSQVSAVIASAHASPMSTEGLLKAVDKLKARLSVNTVKLEMLMKERDELTTCLEEIFAILRDRSLDV
jgi:hypothetical protein